MTLKRKYKGFTINGLMVAKINIEERLVTRAGNRDKIAKRSTPAQMAKFDRDTNSIKDELNWLIRAIRNHKGD